MFFFFTEKRKQITRKPQFPQIEHSIYPLWEKQWRNLYRENC